MPAPTESAALSGSASSKQRSTKSMADSSAKGSASGNRDKQRSATSVSQRRQNDLSDLQRRLSYLTNAIDDTLQRSGGTQEPTASTASERPSVAPNRTSASPAPTRPSVVASRSNSIAAPPSSGDTPVAPPSAATKGTASECAVPTTKLFSLVPKTTATNADHDEPSVATTSTSLRLLPPPVVSPPRERPADAFVARRSRRGLMSPTHERSRRQERVPAVIAPAPVVDREHSVERLKVEEEELKLRIAALKRIEEEKMALIAHQKRLLDLDRERQRLDDERRRSAARSVGARSPSTASSGAGGAPQLAHTTAMTELVAPSLPSQQRMEEQSPAIHLSERRSSPSPILMLSAATPSHDRVAFDDALRSMMRGPPTPHRNDRRFVCREILIDHGIEGRVLTGRHASVGCRLHLSPDAKELLAFPHTRGHDGVQESHHFPLHKGTLLYPNGVVQHHWLPHRVHVSGVVVGNRARSVLLAKGYPHFIDQSPENRLRLYLIVGGEAYSEASTLLVLEMASRKEWTCLLLGLHGAMWPDGKPPLTPGRALWFMACHAVMQLHWDANGTRDTLLHQSRRRSRSAEPSAQHHTQVGGAVPSRPTPPAEPHPLVVAAAGSGAVATSRFAVPSSPPRFAVPSPSLPPAVVPAPHLDNASRYQHSGYAAHNDDHARAPRERGSALTGIPPPAAPPHLVTRSEAQPNHVQSSARPANAATAKTFFPKTSTRPSGRSAILQYGY